MKLPINWLKEYVELPRSVSALAASMTASGLEVNDVVKGLTGPVFDIEVTPNRADCLSAIGMAREVAAITGKRIKPLVHGSGFTVHGVKRRKTVKARAGADAPATLKIAIEDKAGCARYIGRLIRGVRIEPAPQWMQERIVDCGTRPINNIVDITNYVLYEYGQPLHAFDYGRLAEGTIIVRRARKAEPIRTLDEQDLKLDADVTTIADARTAVAVAGIMGGFGSEVVDTTQDILLESAWFDPGRVRRTARRLGIASESSYRFERGVDLEGVAGASERAATLIQEIAGGREVCVKDVGKKPGTPKSVMLNVSELNRWLGTEFSAAKVRRMLTRLYFLPKPKGSAGTLAVSVPSFRRDVTQPVDLYEEIARMAGYEAINPSLPEIRIFARPGAGESPFHIEQRLRRLCTQQGLQEAMTWALVSEDDLNRVGLRAGDALRLANPLSQDQAFLRPALLQGLLQSAKRNFARGAEGVALFELGGCFIPGASPIEQKRLGVLVSGDWSRDWSRTTPSDFFLLKGIVEEIVARWTRGSITADRQGSVFLESEEAVSLRLGDVPLGVAGRVANGIVAAYDLEQPIWFAELSVAALRAHGRTVCGVSLPSMLPPVKRDLSIVVGDGVSFADIRAAILKSGGSRLSKLVLADRYQGKQIEPGKYSITFSIEYRDPEKTLTSDEAEVTHQTIVRALGSRFGATLRS